MACFSLEKYAGRQSRHTCPSCGRPHCFSLYVDEAGTPIDEAVGRCDHESGCGYHRTPKEYFADHPEAVKDYGKEDNLLRLKLREKARQAAKMKRIDTIPFDYVSRSVRIDYDSDLIAYLRSEFRDEDVERVIADYFIGVTKSRDTVFFQVDTEGKVRTGKVMKYDRKNGHRIKDDSVAGRITWIHSLMKSKGLLPQEWELTQCLFGEHLLRAYPDADVCIVESEKTAVICSAVLPQFVWIATGGKSQMDDRRLSVVKGRRVTLFPDVDAFAEWNERARELRRQGYDVKVSDYIEKNATDYDREAKIDIADLILRAKRRMAREKRREAMAAHPPVIIPADIERYTVEAVCNSIADESIDEVFNLIRDCGLIVASASRLAN